VKRPAKLEGVCQKSECLIGLIRLSRMMYLIPTSSEALSGEDQQGVMTWSLIRLIRPFACHFLCLFLFTFL